VTAASLKRPAARALTIVALVLVLVGLWELYRWIWSSAAWTWPFVVDSTSMPHVWTVLKAFGQPAQVNQPALASVLFHKTLFTMKESVVGFGIGAVVGFALGVILVHSRLLQRGFLPYLVASQTIPILAIAPMVVVWSKTQHSKVDDNLYEGTKVTGSPEVVLLRGHVLVENDELVASPGIGQFVKRARFGEELRPERAAVA
jgi:ABC-type nitrate/sulfonate/bicarbonate transport system permease component